MPKFDGTGPGGAGPMTGRGMGPCAKGNAYRGSGQGWGMGRGGCRWPWWIQSSDNKEDVLKDLETEKAELETAIEELRKKD